MAAGPLPAAAPDPDPFNLRKRGSEIQGNNCTQRLTDRQTEQTQGAPLEAAHEAARLQAPTTETLVQKRSWPRLKLYGRIGAVYDFVRNEIAFGYNEGDDPPASRPPQLDGRPSWDP